MTSGTHKNNSALNSTCWKANLRISAPMTFYLVPHPFKDIQQFIKTSSAPKPLPSRTSDREPRAKPIRPAQQPSKSFCLFFCVWTYEIFENVHHSSIWLLTALEKGSNTGWFHQDLAWCVQTEKENPKVEPTYRMC